MANVMLPLTAIVADDANQPRQDDLDEAYIEQLAQVPDLWPPIVVVAIDVNKYALVDGFHRVRAAQQAGVQELAATVIPMPDDGDLVSVSFDLNAKHGRPLSLDDRRAHAERLLRKDPRQPDREISRRCGIAAATVARIRRELEGTAEIEQSTARVGADGRTYATPARRLGELPDPSLAELVSSGLGRLFSSPERREMRKIAQYLTHLAVPLKDQYDMALWETPDDVATACVEVLGPEKARALAHELVPPINNILDVCDVLLSGK